MASLDVGSRVTYKSEDGADAEGTIHAVRKVDSKAGPRVISYLIDTGNDDRIDEFVTKKGKPNIFFRQPEQIEVGINDICIKR